MDAHERELWRRADVVLDELLDLPATQREPRLRALTSDETLRTRVRRLLAAHSQPSGPLDAPPPALALPAAALSGQRLGRWRLREEIGRGGMAVVYRAIAEDGAEGQLAAVKVLTLGSLAQQGRERFLHEQQALLRLRHPCIAALYDAGVAADGTPWLAMALVDGEPIDRWCSQRELDAAARVRLVLQVCQALDCSHRNLVVHRDIKPSNVLVDGDGHVHVLDFGIARLLGEGEGERTRTQLRALTPEYAAPEQFAGAPPSTAMDVYGVGALLYRLLAGTAPRPRGHGDITAPSRALRDLVGDHPTPDQRHHIQHLRGDLDTIVMKALAGRPEDRYNGAGALAEDLRRWLDKRPIRARPPSRRYRLARFFARNRWQMAAAGALVTLLAAGIGGVLWQARVARAEAARASALAEESQAQFAYLGSLLEVLAPSTPEAREFDRGEVIAEATRRARTELAGKPRVLASVEMSLGDLAGKVGEYAQASGLFDSAYTRRRALFGADSAEAAEALSSSALSMTRLNSPRYPLAEARAEKAAAILERRAPRSAALIEALLNHALALGEQDKYPQAGAVLARAEALCAQPLADKLACESLWAESGSFHGRQSRWAEAIAAYRRLWYSLRARLGAGHIQTLYAQAWLGDSYARSGKRREGLVLLEHAHANQQRILKGPTQQSLRTLNGLILALTEANQTPRALALRERYLDEARRLMGERHPDVGLGYADHGSQLFAEARFVEAERAYAKALAVYTATVGADSAAAYIVLGNRADALRELGRAREALPMQRRALQGYETVFGPDNARVAGRLHNLARTEVALGRHAQALAHYDRSIDLYRRHVRDQGASPAHGAYVAAWRARSLMALGRIGEAVAELRRSVAVIEAEAQPNPRLQGEAFAFLIEAACRNGASDCGQLRRRGEADLARTQPHPIPGIARLRLREALAATDRG